MNPGEKRCFCMLYDYNYIHFLSSFNILYFKFVTWDEEKKNMSLNKKEGEERGRGRHGWGEGRKRPHKMKQDRQVLHSSKSANWKWIKVLSTSCFVSMTLKTTGFTSSENILNWLVTVASWRRATVWTKKMAHRLRGPHAVGGTRCLQETRPELRASLIQGMLTASLIWGRWRPSKPSPEDPSVLVRGRYLRLRSVDPWVLLPIHSTNRPANWNMYFQRSNTPFFCNN